MPIEQSRWREANIDSLFYAGSQNFVNRYFNFAPSSSIQQYYFNLIQQPINMVTGFERQNRKGFLYQAFEGGDNQTADQITKLVTHVCNVGDIHEQKSKAKELAAISGMVLAQPYLDFTGDDPAQGQQKLKIWEYNSFLVDPYFRNPDMSDCQFVWCQEYISKHEAETRFPNQVGKVAPMAGTPQRYGNFYFLPENYNMARNDLLVLSYVWYKWKKKKKRLYSKKLNQFFDYAGGDGNLEAILYNLDDMESVTVEVPCWKVAIVLNDQMVFQGENPLGDIGCPFVPYFWNYDPHISDPTLRVRSLVKPMRDPQFLFNYKVINNNDIASATINAGWMRKSGAVANEDNLKRTGQGFDVIINEGYEMTDVQKIIPSAVPQSDLELAQQMADLIYKTSGIDLENWSGQQDKQISTLTMLMKQAANLLVFQKYFDQWDYSDKLLGDKLAKIPQENWNAEKIALMIGEEPTPFFFSRIFTKYQVMVEASDLTPTQQNLQAQQMMEMNEKFGREVFPPSMIIPKLNITGKGEIIPYLQQQEQSMQASQAEDMNIKHTVEEMKIKQLMAQIHNQLSQARERDSRSESNIGLFEERMSMITKNNASASKEKMEALTKLLEAIQKFGELETFMQANNLESIKMDDQDEEKEQRQQVERTEASKRFIEQLMSSRPSNGMDQQSNDMQQAM